MSCWRVIARRPTVLEGSVYAAGLGVVALVVRSPPWLWTFDLSTLTGRVLLAAAAIGGASVFLVASRLPPTVRGHRSRPSQWARTLLTFTLVWAGLWALRGTVRYGDGRAIIDFVEHGVVFHKREPLSPTLFLLAHRSLGRACDLTPVVTIQVVVTTAGTVGMFLLAALARRLTTTPAERFAATAVLSTSGATQLFAGYVENYTIPTVLMIGAMVCALDARTHERKLLGALALWTVSCLFHLSGLVFTPAMVWLAWTRRHHVHVTTALGVTLLPTAAVLALMFAVGFHRSEEIGFGGGDGHMFVPLFELDGLSQYLFLRVAHVQAIANVQLLVAPLGLVLVLGGIAATWKPASMASTDLHDRRFLLAIALAYMGLTVIWNPDLGPLRDWDLFGPVGFYMLGCGVAFTTASTLPSGRRVALLSFVTALNLMRSLPFVLHNAGA